MGEQGPGGTLLTQCRLHKTKKHGHGPGVYKCNRHLLHPGRVSIQMPASGSPAVRLAAAAVVCHLILTEQTYIEYRCNMFITTPHPLYHHVGIICFRSSPRFSPRDDDEEMMMSFYLFLFKLTLRYIPIGHLPLV